MPIYTYRCESCGVRFEKTQKFSDAALTRCPECGKKTLRKVYLPVGIVFKGSGFYSTDNRSPSGANRAGGSHGDDKPASEKESKPSTESTTSAPTSTNSSSESASSSEKADKKDSSR